MTNRAILPLALTVLTIAVPACDLEIEPARSEHGIIQGDPVDGDGFGSVLGIATNAGSICTGTLITPSVVLTAAHCVEPEMLKASIQASGGTPPDEITYAVSFSRDLRDAGETDMIAVDSVEWHAEFLSDLNVLFQEGVTQWNDIALVYLSEPIEDHPVQRIAPTDVVEAVGDEMLAVAGYGQTDDSDPMSAGKLHAGESGMDELGEFEILAGEGDPQQACRGDSGGPIFADGSDTYQIGVASRINASPNIGGEVPGCDTGLLYTRVDAYQEWIAERTDGELPDGEDGDEDGDEDGEDGDGDEDGDGGGCSMAGGSSGPGAALLLLAVALAARRRRRG